MEYAGVESEIDLESNDFISDFDNPAKQDYSALRDSMTENRTALENVGMFIPAVLAKTVDTFVSSMPGVDDDSTYGSDIMENILPDVKSYIADNPNAVGITSDVVGSFLPAGLAIKAVRSGSMLNKMAIKAFGEKANVVFSSGKSNAKLFRPQFKEARDILKNNPGTYDLSSATQAAFAASKSSAIRQRVKDAAIENIAADAAVMLTMNTSLPEEATFMDHLILFGGVNVALTGASYMGAKYAMARGLKNVTSSVQASAANPLGIDLAQISTAGSRGAAIDAWQQFQFQYKDKLEDVSAGEDVNASGTFRNNIVGTQDRLAEEFKKLAIDDPIPGITSSFTLNGGELATAQAVASNKVNGAAFLGITSLQKFESISVMGSRMEDNARKNAFAAEKLKKELAIQENNLGTAPTALQATREKLDAITAKQHEEARLITTILEIDGSITGATKRRPLFQDGARVIKTPRDKARMVDANDINMIASADDKLNSLPTFMLHNKKTGGAGPLTSDNFVKLGMYEMTAMQDLAQAARESIVPDAAVKFDLPANAHHIEIDMVAHAISDKQTGSAVLQKLATGIKATVPGESIHDTLAWESLKGKFVDFQKIQNKQIAENGVDELTHVDYARMLNLPSQDSRVIELFQLSRANKGVINLQNVFSDITKFKAIIDDMEDLRPAGPTKLIGSMQALSREQQPLIAISQPVQTPSIYNLSAKETAMIRRNEVVHALAGSTAAGVSNVAQTFIEQKELVQAIARGVPTLVNGIDNVGAVSRTIGSQGFNARSNPTLQAITRLTDLTDRAASKHVADNVIGPHKEVFSNLMKPGNEGDFVSFSLGHNALLAGWDVSGEALDLAGNFAMPLKATAHNKSLYRQRYGEDMPENALLPTSKANKAPLPLTQAAVQALNSFNNIGQQLFHAQNALLKSQGYREVKAKPFHMLPPNIQGKHMVYLMDLQDNVVQAVYGDTLQSAHALAARASAQYKMPLHTVDEASVEAYTRAKGQLFNEIDDFSNPKNQTGPSTGALSSVVVSTDPKMLNKLIDQLVSGFAKVARDTRVEMLKPYINIMEFQKVASGVGKGAGKEVNDTVWDDAKHLVYGSQRLDETTATGKLSLGFSTTYDRVLQSYFDLRYANSLSGVAAGNSFANKQFESYSAKIGAKFNPIGDINNFLAVTNNIKLPGTMRQHAAAINEVTTNVAIRMFDVGMMGINMLSAVANMPTIINSMNRLPGEAHRDHLDRIGAYGTATAGGLAKLDGVKASTSAAWWMWNSPDAHRLRDLAKTKGYFQQTAAEANELYSRTGETFVKSLARTAVDKASVLTDWSEEWSRGYAFMNAAYVAKNVLKLDDEAAVAFSHVQANNAIADFRPGNRALVFQGASGMPIGLFTTYMGNFLERLYSNVESGQTRTLLYQAGIQATFFGSESLPGFSTFVDTFASNKDNSFNVVDVLNQKIGHDATNFLLNGSVASMTGISIGPRASVGIPWTGANPLVQNPYTQGMPSATLATKAVGVVNGVWDNAVETGELSPAYAAQLFARANINKGTANAIELLQGFGEDNAGNTIETDTRNMLGITARIAGFKPLITDEFKQENRRNTGTDVIRRELKDRLGESLRTFAKQGTLTSENVENALGNYIKAGGDAGKFSEYFNSQMVKGTQSKIDLEIAEALKDSDEHLRLGRLLAIMAE